MTPDGAPFRVTAAATAVVAGVLVVVANGLAILAVGVDTELLADPVGLLTLGRDAARLFRWAWLMDVFGYHLLLIPVIVYLHHWLQNRDPDLVRVSTVFGLGYVLVGAIGLATMAATLPSMMSSWPHASPAQQESLEIAFRTLTDATFFGLTPLAFILGGVWWLGIGHALRTWRPALGMLTTILGVGTLGSGLGFLTQLEPLARLELVNYIVMPIWALWLGVAIGHRKPDRIPPTPASRG